MKNQFWVFSIIMRVRQVQIETRYPGDYPEFSWKEAEEAYVAARGVKEFILKSS